MRVPVQSSCNNGRWNDPLHRSDSEFEEFIWIGLCHSYRIQWTRFDWQQREHHQSQTVDESTVQSMQTTGGICGEFQVATSNWDYLKNKIPLFSSKKLLIIKKINVAVQQTHYLLLMAPSGIAIQSAYRTTRTCVHSMYYIVVVIAHKWSQSTSVPDAQLWKLIIN